MKCLFLIVLAFLTASCGVNADDIDFGFSPPSPEPVISSLSPSSATAGGAAFTLTVNGSGFQDVSSVRWNGSARDTTFVSSSQLTAAIPASDIATAGTAQVTVEVVIPFGPSGLSNSVTFTINNPVAVISSLSPSSATAGGAAFTLTVDGSSFVPDSVVRWNGSARDTAFVSSSQLTAAILTGDISAPGTAQVTVFNPLPGGGTSNALSFAVNPECGNGTCGAGENCLNCAADCGACPQVESMDACGDSMTKAFNAQDQPPCPNSDQEHLNWSTSDTHGANFCSAGSDGVFSHAEALECFKGADIIRADPNSARSGADMLEDFVSQATNIRDTLSVQPGPRYATVLLGHNDICSGTVEKIQTGCPRGTDQDPTNHCWTTPGAFEREFRKGLDILISVDNLKIGVASIVRLSLLCNHAAKESCTVLGPLSCQQLWTGAVKAGGSLCGSLNADCSEERVTDAYAMAKAYREILARVSAEYAAIPEGGTSPTVFVGGEPVGGAPRAAGVTLAYSDATWAFKFQASHLTCCDCFHPSFLGQETLSRILFEGLTCSSTDVCCQDTGDPLADATCQQEDTSGTFYPGFFQTRR